VKYDKTLSPISTGATVTLKIGAESPQCILYILGCFER